MIKDVENSENEINVILGLQLLTIKSLCDLKRYEEMKIPPFGHFCLYYSNVTSQVKIY